MADEVADLALRALRRGSNLVESARAAYAGAPMQDAARRAARSAYDTINMADEDIGLYGDGRHDFGTEVDSVIDSLCATAAEALRGADPTSLSSWSEALVASSIHRAAALEIVRDDEHRNHLPRPALIWVLAPPAESEENAVLLACLPGGDRSVVVEARVGESPSGEPAVERRLSEDAARDIVTRTTGDHERLGYRLVIGPVETSMHLPVGGGHGVSAACVAALGSAWEKPTGWYVLV